MTGPGRPRDRRALSPPAALAHAVDLLARHGFTVAARNERGDSLYLQRAGCTFALRLSNHARTAKQRRRRGDVLASLVVRAPRSPDQVATMAAAALRDFEAALEARAIDPPRLGMDPGSNAGPHSRAGEGQGEGGDLSGKP